MTNKPRKASEIIAMLEPNKKPRPHELTSEHVKHLAGRGLHNPGSLTEVEMRELCGSVLAHIARHEPPEPKPVNTGLRM